MRMLLAGLALLLLSAAGPVTAADAPGKNVFVKRKCNNCHTVNTEGIARAADEADEEAEEESDEEPPDLSGVGARFDAAKMDGWLRKKIAVDGDKHPSRFAGGDDERKVLIDWLLQTRPDPKAKP
jgi:hypothetical protein